ncbi:MAG: internal scaffolding protein [Arizlama microvirus]|nr:MAG: internal scaffolding protein [Arizlama microvirus]
MYYAQNKARTRTTDKTPTQTDQSQAHETDINVIVKRYATTRRVPGTTSEPLYGDFTELPTDLRGMIETSRDIQARRRELPAALRDMPIEELLALTPERITNILTPPTATTEETK